MNSNQSKEQRLETFNAFCYKKEREYFEKSRRARKASNQEKYWEKAMKYQVAKSKSYALLRILRSYYSPKETYLSEKREKEERKQLFLNKHTYGMWFFSQSFNADYGSYRCGVCYRTFYHSPSTIKKAGKVVYGCACGYCTNEIIGADWNEQPYH